MTSVATVEEKMPLAPGQQDQLDQALLQAIQEMDASGSPFTFKEPLREALSAGANPNAVDTQGRSALELASRMAQPFDAHEIMRELLTKGADANGLTSQGVPLIFDVDSPKKVELLVQHGADIELQDAEGNTPLFYALPDYDALCCLVERGVNISHQNHAGQTAVEYYRSLDVGGYDGVALAAAAREENVLAAAEELIAADAKLREGTFSFQEWVGQFPPGSISGTVRAVGQRFKEFQAGLHWLLNHPEALHTISKADILSQESMAILGLHLESSMVSAPSVVRLQIFCQKLGKPLTVADLQKAGWGRIVHAVPYAFFSPSYVREANLQEVFQFYRELPESARRYVTEQSTTLRVLGIELGARLKEEMDKGRGALLEVQALLESMPKAMRDHIPGCHQMMLTFQRQCAQSSQAGRG